MSKTFTIDPSDWSFATQTGPIPVRWGIVDGKMVWKKILIHKEIDTSRYEYRVDRYKMHASEDEEEEY